MGKKGFSKNHEVNKNGQARHGDRLSSSDAGAPVPTPRSPRARRLPPPSVAVIAPSTEVHSNRPLQPLRLPRSSRWRLMRVTPQYAYQPHQPHLLGSHRRSSHPPDFLHRCARLARTHAQLAADCAVGQAAAATSSSAAPIDSTSQQPATQVWLPSAYRCTRPSWNSGANVLSAEGVAPASRVSTYAKIARLARQTGVDKRSVRGQNHTGKGAERPT